MKRGLILGVIVAVGIAIAGLTAQQPAGQAGQGQGRAGGGGQPPLGMIEKIADNLYMIPGQGGNAAVYVAGNGVVLVDTKLADNGPGLLERIRSVTDKPVTMIVNTHTHGDHNGSNVHFPASAEIVTHENTSANMQKMPAFQDAASKHGLPDRTFKDRLTLLSGNDSIDLYYFGPAHTNGDALVVFRNRRVLHAGDMFANRAQPLIDVNNGGSGLAYGQTIGKAASTIRNVDTVITGHNVVLKWPDFVTYGEFTRAMADHARASLKAGKTAEQAMAEFKP
ncbi:MAG: MBL fold metallo-hydrolase, partial [bacterium]